MPTDKFALFDSHLHIVDPRFPLVANQGFVPEPFTAASYRRRMARYRLAGGAVVSGSFQAFDQRYLLDALRDLAANPDALMFGTDLPSTRAPRPYVDEDFALVADALGEAAVQRVFRHNAIEWYRAAAVEAVQ